MSKTIIEQLAEFTAATDYDGLPDEVALESKRILLDSVGCALGGVTEPKGRIGIEYGRLIGGATGDATIIGTAHRTSVSGAAFANGELTNALDFDAVLPPGHVSPYVIPPALAVAESLGSSGKDLLAAIALSHEMSFRFGRSMDWTRDTADGKVSVSAVLGYTSTVFGAAAAVARLRHAPVGVIASALGIAGSISPVNSHRSWMNHAPASTIKYTMAGTVAQAGLTAAFTAELGHRGDLQILDDAEYGYPRFIGTKRWEPSNLTDGLGTSWGWPQANAYKPYPHCRILHGLLDGMIATLEENDIKPEEITAIRAQGEGWVVLPVWMSDDIRHVQDGQFSIAHGLAVGAHRLTPGRAWQDPDVVFSRSVLDLMAKVTYEAHPDWVTAISQNPKARPCRVEIDARGTTFAAERHFQKGLPSPEPGTTMTDEELISKFLVNAEGVIPLDRAEAFIDAVMKLDQADSVATVVGHLRAVRPATALA